ncbi:MAG: hypothetical protein LBJ18_03445 [Rickettsiales bacterium]|jgi:hypothetical protein|nr:hypothetical protein [Rickettsiales bacterium]
MKKKHAGIFAAASVLCAGKAAAQEIVRDTVRVQSESALIGLRPALYNLPADKIFINHFISENPDADLQTMIKMLNLNHRFALAHEKKHAENAKIILSGFSAAQIAEFCIYDEVSARLTDMAERRKVLAETGDFTQAFAGEILFDSNGREVGYMNQDAYLYYKFLSGKKIKSAPDEKEINAMLDAIAAGLKNDTEQYAQEFASMTSYRIKVQTGGTPSDFGDVCAGMFEIGGIDFYKPARLKKIAAMFLGSRNINLLSKSRQM